MMNKIKVAGAALNQLPLDWEWNCNNILEAIKEAQDKGVDLLCFPELSITGYGCEDLFLSHWLPEEAMKRLVSLVPHTTDIAVAFSLPIIYEGLVYNCSCLVQNQKILGFTAKQFLANDGVHYEPRWFTSWIPDKLVKIEVDGNSYELGDLTYEIKGYKIGFEICEDAWREDKRPAWKHLQ